MKRTTSIFNNLLLILFAMAIAFFLSFLFSSFPPHKHLDNGVCDISNSSFDGKSRYPICNDFTRTMYDAETHAAVYECNILLPSNVSSVALRVPPIDASNNIYINDKLVFYRQNYKNDTLFATPRVVIYTLDDDDNHMLHIVLNVTDASSFYTMPSLNPITHRDIIIGSVSAIYFFQNLYILFDVVLISICVISTAFHFIAFLYRNITKVHIYFSLLSLSGIICILVSNQRCISFAFDSLPLEIGTKILVIGYFLRLFSLLELEKVAFRNILRKRTFAFLRIANYILLIVLLAIPVPVFYYAYSIYHVLTTICIILAIDEGMHSYRYDHDASTRVLIIGYVLLFIGSFSDLTHGFGLSKAYSTFYVAQIAFILLQSIITSIDYSNSLKNNQKLTADLKQKVFALQNNESSFITSHINPKYIYSTLNIIENNIDKDQDKVDRLIQSLSKYLRHTFDYTAENNMYSYKNELELCYALADMITTKSPHIKIDFDIDDNLPNIQIPMFSMAALIENAMTYAFKGILHPTIKISVKNTGKYIEFSVHDNGIGLSRSEISYALEHPYTTITYGLYQINQVLIDKCHSKLQIYSEINKYTNVSFLIHVEELEEDE